MLSTRASTPQTGSSSVNVDPVPEYVIQRPAPGVHGPPSRLVGWRLSPGQRKLVLAAHIVVSVGLFGLSAAMFVLGTVAVTTSDAETGQAAYRSMRIFTRGVVQPVALGALVSGLILSLGTRWGVVRHYWIVTKLALTVATVLCGIFVVGPLVQQAIGMSSDVAMLPAAGRGSAPIVLVAALAANVLMLGAATVISVYKPWGTIRRGRPAGRDGIRLNDD